MPPLALPVPSQAYSVLATAAAMRDVIHDSTGRAHLARIPTSVGMAGEGLHAFGQWPGDDGGQERPQGTPGEGAVLGGYHAHAHHLQQQGQQEHPGDAAAAPHGASPRLRGQNPTTAAGAAASVQWQQRNSYAALYSQVGGMLLCTRAQ